MTHSRNVYDFYPAGWSEDSVPAVVTSSPQEGQKWDDGYYGADSWEEAVVASTPRVVDMIHGPFNRMLQ